MREPFRPRTALSRGRHGRPASILVLTTAAVAFALTGCSRADAICGGGEYPVLNVGSTGSACAPDDQEPPKGYTRYPKGKVPEHVGDKWDVYWQSHTVDESGKTVKAPKD